MTKVQRNKTHDSVANWVEAELDCVLPCSPSLSHIHSVCQKLTNETFWAQHKFNKQRQIRQCLPKVCYAKVLRFFFFYFFHVFLRSSPVNWKSRPRQEAEAAAAAAAQRKLSVCWLPSPFSSLRLILWPQMEMKMKMLFHKLHLPVAGVSFAFLFPLPAPLFAHSFKLNLRLGGNFKGQPESHSTLDWSMLRLSYATCCRRIAS